MTAADLIALAEGVERMTTNEEPRRDTLLEIFRAARPRSSFEQGWQSDDARQLFVMMWEAGGCIDAAAMIVPKGWCWATGTAAAAQGGHAFLMGPLPDQEHVQTDAASPALALTAAALRARAMELTDG